MANIASQIKRNRQNEKRRLRNKSVRAELRTRTKNAVTAAETGAEDSVEQLRLAVKRIDKAAARGVIHKNTAANHKSRLVRRVAALEAAQRRGRSRVVIVRHSPGSPTFSALSLSAQLSALGNERAMNFSGSIRGADPVLLAQPFLEIRSLERDVVSRASPGVARRARGRARRRARPGRARSPRAPDPADAWRSPPGESPGAACAPSCGTSRTRTCRGGSTRRPVRVSGRPSAVTVATTKSRIRNSLRLPHQRADRASRCCGRPIRRDDRVLVCGSAGSAGPPESRRPGRREARWPP